MGRMLANPLLHAALVVLLAGCCSTPEPETRVETVTVKEPVPVQPEPPEWLTAPLFRPDNLPAIFVEPDNPDAVLGVTRDGLQDFWRAVDIPIDRLQAWEAWATPAGGKR